MAKKNELTVSQSGLLEEYKELRQELMWHSAHAEKTMTHFLVLVSILIGYGVTQNAPLLFLIAWFIDIEYWRKYIAHRGYVAKISRYIVRFIESQIIGINWESRVQKADSIATHKGIQTWQGIRIRFIRTVFGPHSVLAFTCLILFVYRWVCPNYNLSLAGTVTAYLAAIIFHMFWIYRRLTPSFINMRMIWDDVWEELEHDETRKKNETGGVATPKGSAGGVV